MTVALRTRSIRFQLTAWYALVLLAALALFGGLLWVSLRRSLYAELDQDLANRAAQFQAYTAQEVAEGQSETQLKDELGEFCQALPPGSSLHLRGSKGFAFDYPQGGAAGEGRFLQRHFEAGGAAFELELTGSLHQTEHTLDLVRVLLLSILPLVVIVAVLGGAWLSRRALRPVDEVTEAARATGIENLSRRLPVPQTGDELQRLAETWNETLGRLEHAVGTLSQFAADASHELRTPIAVIRTSAELALRRARTPEGYRESLEGIAAEAARMTQLVEDLLLLARTDAQAAEMPKERIGLRDLLDEVAAQVRRIAAAREIRVRTSWPEGLEPVVTGNAAALRRLFLVLLDNAVKYSGAGSEVVLALRTGDGVATVEVEDHGCGIRAADRAQVFERFYQADPSRRDGGFGLGLSLARSIARAHGTEIELDSTEGVGTRFWVRFAAEARRPLASRVGAA